MDGADVQPTEAPAADDPVAGTAAARASVGNASAGRRATRTMVRADVPAVAALFKRVFRGDASPPSAAFSDYFEAMLFSSPRYDPAFGSVVHDAPDGAIDAVIASFPIEIAAGDTTYRGRILSSYMTENRSGATAGGRSSGTRGGGDLPLTLRRRNHDFLFTDTAKPVSADVMLALGGHVLPIHSLEWIRVFGPVSLALRLAERRFAVIGRLPLDGLARLADRLARLVVRALAPPPMPEGTRWVPMSSEAFIAAAPGFVTHYAVRPVWAPDELGWLIEMARRRTWNGPLTFRAVEDAKGRTIGAVAYFGGPGRAGVVLNLLAAPGAERAVVATAIAAIAAEGVVALRGTAQPGQLEALERVPGLMLRRNGFAVAISRQPAIEEAIRRGDIYIGGLAGEVWSRLIADRF